MKTAVIHKPGAPEVLVIEELPVPQPASVNLTSYSGSFRDFINTPLQTVVHDIEKEHLAPRIGRLFKLDDIVEAHRCMENNAAVGKIVILT